MDVPDPFVEGIPDFGDERLNLIARNFAQGVETGRALASMDKADSLVSAIAALDETQLRVTLLAMTLWYRAASDPAFRPEWS